MIRGQRRIHPWLWFGVLAVGTGLLALGLALTRSSAAPVGPGPYVGATP